MMRLVKHHRLLWAGAISILVAGGTAILIVTQTSPPPPLSMPTPVKDTPAAEPQLVYVSLPGAAPFPALIDNYTLDTSLWRVVNKSHFLTDIHYRPANLQQVSVPSRADKSTDERSLRADILPHIEALFGAAQTEGIQLLIGSGFRGYDLQMTYYTNYVKNYGQAAADTFSAKPGSSEHQTGLAMDLATADMTCYLEECFAEATAGRWLAAHAHKYGFVLRYPKDKESITGFRYEPWHFRYVGPALAEALHTSGLTLDEALSYLETARQSLLQQGKITE